MLKRARERERGGMNKRRSLMTAADSPIQKETTEGFLATVEAVLIALPYCTELLSKMLCLPLFIQAKVCVCSGTIRTACVLLCGWQEDEKVCVCMCVCARSDDRMCACAFACIRANMHVRTERLMTGKCVCVCTWREKGEGCKAELN